MEINILGKLAMIPARGGSKRIPRKNIRNFLGKPIIAYSILTAIESDLFDEVMVSTDDEEIAEVARSFGAEVPFFRSTKNADEHATTVDVVNEVLGSYSRIDKQFSSGCCIYPTTPMLTVNTLKAGLEMLQHRRLPCVFSALQFPSPVLRAFSINDRDEAKPIWPEYIYTRSQDLAPAYHDAGQFYWFDVERFLLSGKLLGEGVGALIVSEMEAQDIDTEEDWLLAEMKYRARAR